MAARMDGSGCLTVAQLGRDPVVIVCWECRKIGVYRLRRFRALVGPQTLAPDAVRLIARRSCVRALDQSPLLSQRCRASYYLPEG